MEEFEDLGIMTGDKKPAEDENSDCALALRQQFLQTWQGPIALGPFAASIFVVLIFFQDSPSNWIFIAAIMATVVWAVAIRGYILYLQYQQ